MFSLSVLKQFKVSHERVEGLENSQKNLSGIPFKQFNLSSWPTYNHTESDSNANISREWSKNYRSFDGWKTLFSKLTG